jgi:predicted AlkP superfamily pyrophosphatase or phosphodiesterase
MLKRWLSLIVFLFASQFLFAQQTKNVEKPKLVVGLVIDQMRWDYLYRFHDLFGEGGFKRLMNDGFSCDQTYIPYVPTYTAPGHASVYTGSVPAINGIIANDWYELSIKKNMYCAADSTVSTVGSSSLLGKMSPRNLLVTTISDELRLSTNFRSKVIGVSLKDRGAIMPAGHSANAAYWYDDEFGKWISSTYYQNDLPSWVKKENEKLFPDKAMTTDWNTLLPIEKYVQSTGDNKSYESLIGGEKSPVFPQRFSQVTGGKYAAFKSNPAAMTYTFNMAQQAISNEKLGADEFTDLLAVSISTTDYVGHAFGPNSIELEDTYLRLDRDIAHFLNFLDRTVGRGNYLLFLTADHAVAHVPGFLEENKIPGGLYNYNELANTIRQKIDEKFQVKNAIVKVQNNQVYLDEENILSAGKKLKDVEEEVVRTLNDQPFIQNAFVTNDLASVAIPETVKQMLINGYNPKRSGQVGFVPLSNYMSGGKTGTTHGSWNSYDAHIPLLWFGTGIKKGNTNRKVYMTDIAPTLAALLNIQTPGGNVGNAITEVVK